MQATKINKYDTYKDSGIEWIGEIPQNWKTLRIKNVAWLKGRIGWQGLKSDEYQETGAYLITGTDFDNGKINWDTCVHITQERFDEAPEIHIIENDLLITKDGTVGKVALALNCPQDVSLNSGVLLIRNTKDIKYNSKYLYYILLSDVFWNWFTSNLNGNSTIIHLYQEQFYNFSFSYPTIDEQQAIADYLDKKCGEIDKVVEAEKSVIEKLKEYKQSIITEAVTKGLDKSVPLKDSGIEWIGKMPQHWEVTSIKNVIKGIKDGTHGTFERVSDGEYLLSAKNVFEDGIHIENESLISTEDYNSIISNGYPQKGDILICCVGTIGRCCIYKEEKSIAFQRSVSFLRTKDIISNKFLLYLLKSNSTQIQLNQMANASAQAGIYMGALKNIKVVFVDDYKEQEIIATYLDKKCSEIDKAIADKEQLIEKFTEYKKSLIYECVTGKRKVV